jgi:hypothetical protein
MRYIRVSSDVNEICGLGITQISGLASFSQPATFRLKRISESAIRVTTDSGISLDDKWLRGSSRCIETLTFGDQWMDVTAHCQNGSIPASVVQEWSNRNQRMLVDFRISL